MLIERKHPFSGVVSIKEIPVTQEQLNAWESGTLIQDAMPTLTASEREFIKTGLVDEDFG
jgi:hypothetical protein